MKKSILYFLALCVLVFSCSKTDQKTLLVYSVTDIHGNPLENVYIPDNNGSATLPVMVKFFTGNTSDSVKITLTGLPANITTPTDTFSAKPTYTTNFPLTISNAIDGTYPMKIIAYTPTSGYRTYNFNLIITPASCATLFNGTINGSNACSATKYTYTSTGTASGPGTLTINNFGGYGTNTNAIVTFDCNNYSLTIASQNIGNGVTVAGSGTYTNNSMTIQYTATNIPTGGNDNCTVTYSN